MSIVIALIVVLVVGALIAKYYPTPKATNTLAKGEMLTPDSEDLIKLSSKEEEVAVPTTPPLITTKPSDEAAAKMSAKPKKKYYHNKNTNKKPKTNK